MTGGEKLAFVRRCMNNGAVLWSAHATQRLVAHHLARASVQLALAAAEIIEDYPDGHRPLPDCLVLGFDAAGEPVHAVIALDVARDRVMLVTVYRPSATRWKDDWRTRR